MPISITRKLTEKDRTALNNTIYRFVKRWGIKVEKWEDPWDLIQLEISYGINKPLIRAWRRCFARALKEKESVHLTIYNCYIGHYVD